MNNSPPLPEKLYFLTYWYPGETPITEWYTDETTWRSERLNIISTTTWQVSCGWKLIVGKDTTVAMEEKIRILKETLMLCHQLPTIANRMNVASEYGELDEWKQLSLENEGILDSIDYALAL